MNELFFAIKELDASTKSMDKGQPAQFAKADLGQNFLFIGRNFLYIRCSYYLMRYLVVETEKVG